MKSYVFLSKFRLLFGFIIIVIVIYVLLMYLSVHEFVAGVKKPVEINLNPLLNSSSQKLLNIPFRYVLNNELLCANTNGDILAVIIVTSYLANVETRNSMRRAFSAADLMSFRVRRVFLLGVAPTDKYIKQSAIESESQTFGDIVQGNFTEAYRNLTYKHIMGLKWATRFCSNSKYIIKMDDDIVVNMYKLEQILKPLTKISNKKFIAGYVLRNMLPIRDPDNKWFVTKEEFSFNHYPSFVSGWFYITNYVSAKNIVLQSNHEKYFWIDDLFITGIIASKLKVMLYDISQHFTPNSEFLQCCLQDFDKNIICDISVGPNGGNCMKRVKLINETCVAERKFNLGRGIGQIRSFKLK
ncbi:beta-1,3-galactosyltransferase 5-like [Rhynchophorus ferrugineus]|uniref:beta-1,3-galactosyltransferase 5-like n=1 Tax=Rhynchophorus ferrugineus TaxID=354439 RepID=UPI003FCE2706